MKKHNRIPQRTQLQGLGYHEAFDPIGLHFNWPGSAFHRDEWTPIITLEEAGGVVHVETEVPGIDPSDIDITIQGRTLTISGENKRLTADDSEDYYHVRQRYGRFRGSIRLPKYVDPDSVEATCHDDVLSIDLHKIDRARTRHIGVKA